MMASLRRLTSPRHSRPVWRIIVVATITIVALACCSAALAYWNASGGGTAVARTEKFDLVGPTPLLRAVGHDVVVTWEQSRLLQRLGGRGPGGYKVRRYDAAGHQQVVQNGCSNTISGPGSFLRCVEQNIPPGHWYYSVTPVLGDWNATEGPKNIVKVGTAVTTAVIAPEDGSTIRVSRPSIDGIADAMPDSPPRIIVVVYQGLSYDDILVTLDAAVTDGTWSARPDTRLADGVYTVRARQVSRKGHAIWSATNTFRIDTSAPVTADDASDLGEQWHRDAQTVTLSPTDPGGSGVAATYFTVDGSTPTTDSRAGTKVTVDADGVHVIRYLSLDRAGNAEGVRSSSRILLDRTAPENVKLKALPRVVASNQILTASGVDTLSGVAEVVFEFCPVSSCDIWTAIDSDSTGPTYSVAWHAQPENGTYWVRARILDKAGNATASASQTVRVDDASSETTAPSSSSR
jgi:hypothetical protein